MPEINKYTKNELKDLQYFRDLNDTILDSIGNVLHVKTFKMGELLFGDNKSDSSIYFLISGELRQHVNHPVTNKS